jgi:uncharacterized membrane protein
VGGVGADEGMKTENSSASYYFIYYLLLLLLLLLPLRTSLRRRLGSPLAVYVQMLLLLPGAGGPGAYDHKHD